MNSWPSTVYCCINEGTNLFKTSGVPILLAELIAHMPYEILTPFMILKIVPCDRHKSCCSSMIAGLLFSKSTFSALSSFLEFLLQLICHFYNNRLYQFILFVSQTQPTQLSSRRTRPIGRFRLHSLHWKPKTMAHVKIGPLFQSSQRLNYNRYMRVAKSTLMPTRSKQQICTELHQSKRVSLVNLFFTPPNTSPTDFY